MKPKYAKFTNIPGEIFSLLVYYYWIFHLLFIELLCPIIQNRNAEGLMQLRITEG